MKFLIHNVYLESSYPNFQKKFVSSKMAAILNFRIFRKNCKTQKDTEIFRYRVMCELKMLTITSDNMTLCIFF